MSCFHDYSILDKWVQRDNDERKMRQDVRDWERALAWWIPEFLLILCTSWWPPTDAFDFSSLLSFILLWTPQYWEKHQVRTVCCLLYFVFLRATQEPTALHWTKVNDGLQHHLFEIWSQTFSFKILSQTLINNFQFSGLFMISKSQFSHI